MIVNSKLKDEKYFWVRVPRTGTMSYTKLFGGKDYDPVNKISHNHQKYINTDCYLNCSEEVSSKYKSYPAFSLVRHPVSRMVSILNKMTQIAYRTQDEWDQRPGSDYIFCSYCEQKIRRTETLRPKEASETYKRFISDEDFFYKTLYEIFNKNCQYKNIQYKNIHDDLAEDLIRSGKGSGGFFALFRTQTEMAYHPKVKIFKYENISEFNNWIENTLGYDVSKLETRNKSETFTSINTNTNRFKELVEYLFHDDFKLFGYTI